MTLRKIFISSVFLTGAFLPAVTLAQTATSTAPDEPGFAFSVDLTVNGKHSPQTLPKNTTVKIAWTSDGASFCTGSWSKKQLAATGSTSGKITKTLTFSISCDDDQGNTASDAVLVTVEGVATGSSSVEKKKAPIIVSIPAIPKRAPISVDLKANTMATTSFGPLTISPSDLLSLSWFVNGPVNTCKADWYSDLFTSSGFAYIDPSISSVSKTYTLTCYDYLGNHASDSVVVNVSATSTADTASTTPTAAITVTGPLNSFIAPTQTLITWTSSNVSRAKVKICWDRNMRCDTLAPELAVASSSSSVPWSIRVGDPYVGKNDITIRITDLDSGFYAYSSSTISILAPVSSFDVTRKIQEILAGIRAISDQISKGK